ncbi:LacI family DNA-binding transcriptional regulator [Paenibacillus kribbensis]|uniref:LacI family DNA-binding transcriptional regulator n=1 Tax=Paenibacillus TaxID=44249 RepID=UPI00024F022B|nr:MULTISPECIES: LacI family DNA-binding transcriptional regulator [Paenibacillus]EHS59224.1 LacI family transcription regulator [Paenibacillus sp. Aloe-11]MEC0236820.1 LacI family DNA-binding transcriptional regulator [Paenibacillus kribbensis]
MATIKDVANLANVSVTTVSIVINGKAKERKIPQRTYNKVMEAMNALNYHPNLSARRLRSTATPKPIIALYWPLDYRTNMLASFLHGIQSELNEMNYSCELVIRTYQNNEIDKDANEIIKNTYDGVIIGATSLSDLEYLESLNPRIPLVLINRESQKYSTVSVNHNDVANKGAQLLSKKGYQQVSIVIANNPYVGASLRTKAFLNACAQNGITIEKEHIIEIPNSTEGGILAAKRYCEMDHPPKVLFCESDSIALSMIYQFNKMGVKIPEDIELLSIGLTGPESTMYSTPPITIINMPSEKIAGTAISIIIDSLNQDNTDDKLSPIHKTIMPEVYIRDSFML